MFLEKKRSRSGKLQHSDEILFDIIVDQYFKQTSGGKDFVFVPVTINYDRVLEGDTFPLDLLGLKT